MKRLTAVLCCMAAACSSPSGDAGGEKQYALTGYVTALRKESAVATIRHEDIKDSGGKLWMAAMTMEFPVRDKAAFAKLEVGQRIRATVHQRESDYEYWIGEIQWEPQPPQ